MTDYNTVIDAVITALRDDSDLSYVPGAAFDDLAALRERLASALAAR